MKASAFFRNLVWPTILTIVVVALTTASVSFRNTATLRAATPKVAEAPTPAAGVVCFGTVDLEHGATSLFPLQPGRVVEVLVHENQEVAAHAELIRLEDGPARSKLAEAETTVDLCRLQLDQERQMPDKQRKQVEQQEAIQKAASARVAAARQVWEQRQRPAQPAFRSPVEIVASELEVRELESLAHVEALRLAEIKGQDIQARIRRAEYEYATASARRDQARFAVEECRLKAPRRGKILRILVGPGDVLGGERSQPAVLFAADEPYLVRATVEQEFASRVKEGAPALVQDESDSSTSWRGRVQLVAGWYSQRRAVLHDPSQLSDVRTLECLITLEPGQGLLRLGQGVRVSIGNVPPG